MIRYKTSSMSSLDSPPEAALHSPVGVLRFAVAIGPGWAQYTVEGSNVWRHAAACR
jgi:hypothetical protein